MSTDLIDEDSGKGFYLTRFWGGKDRGTCYQITQKNGKYVALTKDQIKALVDAVREEGYPPDGGKG
jgi:hypothetical protein